MKKKIINYFESNNNRKNKIKRIEGEEEKEKLEVKEHWKEKTNIKYLKNNRFNFGKYFFIFDIFMKIFN